MKADPSAQLKLLEVQELDSRLDALRHQASHPPEGPELRDLESSRTALRDQAADLQIQVDDLTRAQRKADDDVEQVKARRVRDQQRLDSGAVTSPKDLERLQHELVSLDRRIGELEDTELEIMAHLEDVQRDLAEVQAHTVEQDARVEALNATRVERLTGLKAEGADVVARRKEAAATLPADLLGLYERLREQKQGVGAALLRQRRCAGCSLEAQQRRPGHGQPHARRRGRALRGVRAHPGPHRRVRPLMVARPGEDRPTRVVAEADGASRGNPGNAAYGAVLKDRDSGEVIAERGERIGVATNNVAEYRGLIAALELYRDHADGAELEVLMDSKLVVEQMSGRWKIKHPDMRPLASRARDLAPEGTTYSWIPRERNQHADRLANQALDGPMGVVVGLDLGAETDPDHAEPVPTPPWEQGAPTVLVLVRHGETDDTEARVFSGSTGGDPALNALGVPTSPPRPAGWRRCSSRRPRSSPRRCAGRARRQRCSSRRCRVSSARRPRSRQPSTTASSRPASGSGRD